MRLSGKQEINNHTRRARCSHKTDVAQQVIDAQVVEDLLKATNATLKRRSQVKKNNSLRLKSSVELKKKNDKTTNSIQKLGYIN